MSQDETNDTLITYRTLHEAVQVAHAHGLMYAVLCPGSRSAPIALSLMRHEGIKHYILADERSAAYTALGMARATRSPVALVCTSGTASLNFSPAIAEAFFSNVPLIVFTADRPPEWLGQADNQAIYQDHLYYRHVKAQFTFPLDLHHPDARWHAIRQINEAMRASTEAPSGPVHINVPLREPLYLKDAPRFEGRLPKISIATEVTRHVPVDLIREYSHYKRVLCIGGLYYPAKELSTVLGQVINELNMVFIPDATSNLHDVPGAMMFAELVLENSVDDNLEPDLIISFGGPIVSRKVRDFLRNSVAHHWHIGRDSSPPDTFQKLSKIISVDPIEFFSQLKLHKSGSDLDYHSKWRKTNELVHRRSLELISDLPFSEIKAMAVIFDTLPKNSVLHLGNSLPVRYASVFPMLPGGIEVFANRGTSGIDGCVSAAVGHSMVDERIHTAIVGDLTFLYDGNGLWNNYLKPNLKIIVLNNHGGGIFRSLPGSARQPELEEYFVVKQPKNVEHAALQNGCEYFRCDNEGHLDAMLNAFYGVSDKPAVLELEFAEQVIIGEVKEMILNG